MLGAAIFLFSTIVDGCDGEIARSKLLESAFGKLYDTGVDIVIGLAVFVAVSVGVWRELGSTPEVVMATTLIVLGGILAPATVETVRRIIPGRLDRGVIGRVNEWVERFATLEWSYVVLALALADQLPFFFFGSAAGANVFALVYLVTGAIALRGRN